MCNRLHIYRKKARSALWVKGRPKSLWYIKIAVNTDFPKVLACFLIPKYNLCVKCNRLHIIVDQGTDKRELLYAVRPVTAKVNGSGRRE